MILINHLVGLPADTGLQIGDEKNYICFSPNLNMSNLPSGRTETYEITSVSIPLLVCVGLSMFMNLVMILVRMRYGW
jgi:hypothetical protein